MVRKTCPVDVISVCSASGDIRPLRLRVEDEEQGWKRGYFCAGGWWTGGSGSLH